jgi:hypothetical protein
MRRGYAEVRIPLQVRAGVPLEPFAIVCSELQPASG